MRLNEQDSAGPHSINSGARMTAGGEGREVLFEFTVVGTVMKVAAIDAGTGIEVTVMGPAHASRGDLQKLALAKLKRRLSGPEKR